MKKPARAVVGLSGGVDSAVAAKLLLDQGYEVLGVFLKNWEEDRTPCPAAEDAADAERVADQLGIPFYRFNFSKEYWEHVFAYFLEEHRAGRTPNPDILCNKYIKFGVFLQEAQKLGADYIATGHYAGKQYNPETKTFELCIPKDKNKDQTYFLYTLQPSQLEKTIFPLDQLCKAEVREIARAAGFANAEKKDSTGICFIGERNHAKFLGQYIAKHPGPIITPEGVSIGTHTGLSFYTIGQRKEIGIGGVRGAKEAPWFVVRKDFATNHLVVSQDETLLLSSSLQARDLSWTREKEPGTTFSAEARIRYRQTAQPCTVHIDGTEAIVQFKIPQRAITPGQSIVFYQKDVCLGGGIIEETKEN